MTNRPWLMITTRSTVWATSARTWLDTSTLPPSAANARRKSRSQRIPSGSRPFAGSSSTSSSGSPRSAAARPEPLAHAERVALHPAAGRLVELHEARAPPATRRPRDARRDGERSQVVAAAPARVEVRRLEDGADPSRRVPKASGTGCRARAPARLSEPRARGECAASSSSPHRSGPRNPVTVPRLTVNERSSTAVMASRTAWSGSRRQRPLPASDDRGHACARFTRERRPRTSAAPRPRRPGIP